MGYFVVYLGRVRQGDEETIQQGRGIDLCEPFFIRQFTIPFLALIVPASIFPNPSYHSIYFKYLLFECGPLSQYCANCAWVEKVILIGAAWEKAKPSVRYPRPTLQFADHCI